jgi:hypothetical protein
MRGLYDLDNYLLRSIFHGIQTLSYSFSHVSIHNVYMENNEMEDGFPKARLLLDVTQ